MKKPAKSLVISYKHQRQEKFKDEDLFLFMIKEQKSVRENQIGWQWATYVGWLNPKDNYSSGPSVCLVHQTSQYNAHKKVVNITL